METEDMLAYMRDVAIGEAQQAKEAVIWNVLRELEGCEVRGQGVQTLSAELASLLSRNGTAGN